MPAATCRTGKRKFETRPGAEAELRSMNPQPPQYTYKCSHCKGWHLTRQNPVTRVVNGMTRTQRRRAVRKRARLRRSGSPDV